MFAIIGMFIVVAVSAIILDFVFRPPVDYCFDKELRDAILDGEQLKKGRKK